MWPSHHPSQSTRIGVSTRFIYIRTEREITRCHKQCQRASCDFLIDMRRPRRSDRATLSHIFQNGVLGRDKMLSDVLFSNLIRVAHLAPPTASLSLCIYTTSSDPNLSIKTSSFKGLFYISNSRETIILSCHGRDSKTINKRKGSSFLIYKLCLIIHLPLMRQSAGNVFSPRASKI